ncbi:MAG TPA: carboxypeptidase regulatory-like domain-containing protein [Marmoricola sp.]|nr:carboxypeptidase regulatory-like domain-containing protein [Marmoricola sp.]
MRARLLALLLTCFVVLGAAAAHADTAVQRSGDASASEGAPAESLKGTLRGPDGKPVAGVTITVAQDAEEVGSAETGSDGAWEVVLPGSGEYTVTVDVDTLPDKLQLRDRGGETLPGVAVRQGQQRTVIFPLIPTSQQQQGDGAGAESDSGDGGGRAASGGPGFFDRFIQLFVEGIKFGAIIAITAVGLSLIFGTTRIINFAHGELVTIGALVAFWFSTDPMQLPLVLAAVVAIVVGAASGGAMEAGIFRPMRQRGAGLIQLFIISIGVSLLIRHVILIIFGARRSQYRQYSLQSEWHLGPISITPRDVVVTALSVVVLLGVAFMLQRTRIGKAMRAISDNRDLAESSGIHVNRVVLIVWMVGGGLAGLGGVFYGLTTAVYWDMGFNLLLLMFAGVILGGLGSAYGAMVGSFVVGLVAQLSTLWFPLELQNAWALLALILVLIVRPQGILGRAERAG